MAAKPPYEPITPEWDVQTITLYPASLNYIHFGLTQEDVNFVAAKFEREGLYKQQEKAQGIDYEFTFSLLKTLLQYLHQNNLDTSKLSESIKQLKTPAKNKSIEELQVVIESLTPSGTIPFEVKINGELDEQTKHAVNFLTNTYHIANKEPNEKLTAQLQEISSRVIRLHTEGPDALALVPYDPFCFISSRGNKFKITLEEKAALVSHIADNFVIAELPGIVNRNAQQIQLYHVFCQWFMLLQLQRAGSVLSKLLDIPGQTEGVVGNQNYIAPIDSSFELTPSIIEMVFKLRHFRPRFYLAGILFSNDMRFEFIDLKEFEESANLSTITFNPGNFYGVKTSSDRAAVVKGNARILKICAVTRELRNKLLSLSNEEAFYELIAASSNDLFDTMNIGLDYNAPHRLLSIIRGDVGHKVLIEGIPSIRASENVEVIYHSAKRSGDFEVIIEEEMLYISDLRQLENQQSQVHTSSEQLHIEYSHPEFALDILKRPEQLHRWLQLRTHQSNLQDTNTSYELSLHMNYVPGNYRDEAFVELGEPEDFIEMDYANEDGNWSQPAFKLRIRNTGNVRLYAYSIYLEYDLGIATEYFPRLRLEPGQSAWLNVEESGSVSQVIKLRLNRAYQNMGITEITEYLKLIVTAENISINELALAGITNKEKAIANIPELNVTDLLPQNADARTLTFRITRTIKEKQKSPDVGIKQFREIVRSLYEKQPIYIREDLQKRRWGGKNKSNGKRLSATVRKLSQKLFRIELFVTPINGAYQLTGPVAFFLHDSFTQPIEFVQAEDGLARLETKAFEAFTVAAYTSDGTMLELDLNQQKGYPHDFYYVVPTQDFKQEVEKQDSNRAVTIGDDRQKNRWGGQSTANNKVIKATVKKRLDEFIVNLTVESIDDDAPLKGAVAFFLHETFEPEIIEYASARNGKATLEVKASDGFTVGVLTEDGTTLELDLNEVKGYPKDFYS